MKIKYCLPIIKISKQDALKTINENIKDYQYFEVWLDYITDLDNEFVIELAELLQDKLIILFRRKNLEKIHMKYPNRLVILALLKNSKVFVDVDIFANKKELNYLKLGKGKISTIISYHNYKSTPSDRTLKSNLIKMKHYNPTIIKFSTFCKTEKDAVRLLQLQQLLKGQKHIVLGMGASGTITRVFGTLWGNEMIFAPKVIAENSAPGQLTKQELEEVFETLNK